MSRHNITLKDPAGWKLAVDANVDAYGACVMRYAERWAFLMEHEMEEEGKTVAQVAKATSNTADEEGITGFMYGCAVSILSRVWIHGEELRRWHNLDTQIGHEGERANEKGTVLNPAILVIGDAPPTPS